jgi:hypothetical protein
VRDWCTPKYVPHGPAPRRSLATSRASEPIFAGRSGNDGCWLSVGKLREFPENVSNPPTDCSHHHSVWSTPNVGSGILPTLPPNEGDAQGATTPGPRGPEADSRARCGASRDACRNLHREEDFILTPKKRPGPLFRQPSPIPHNRRTGICDNRRIRYSPGESIRTCSTVFPKRTPQCFLSTVRKCVARPADAARRMGRSVSGNRWTSDGALVKVATTSSSFVESRPRSWRRSGRRTAYPRRCRGGTLPPPPGCTSRWGSPRRDG